MRRWRRRSAVSARRSMRQPGSRVALGSDRGRLGTVRHERSGFVSVRWDAGYVELVWGAELVSV
jgi:hypothetical protein